MAEALLKKNRPACMRFKYTRKNLEERGARKILGEVNQRKDTVASIVNEEVTPRHGSQRLCDIWATLCIRMVHSIELKQEKYHKNQRNS